MSDAESSPAHKWTADRSLQRLEDDKLVREPFADRIAKELLGWHHTKESLVVSLNGDWGSGKTTFKNFILRCLERRTDQEKRSRIPVVEFNPWQWSGQKKVLEAFFDEIGAVFQGGAIPNAAKAETLARFWEGLKVASIAGGEIAARLQESLTALAALLAGGSGILSSFMKTPFAQGFFAWSSVVLFAIATGCAVYAPFAEKLGEYFKWKAQKPRQSLDEVRASLCKELESLDAPILVVIDDIDRLTKKEIQLVVQLVKANANFPNVVYLLLFQKSIIAAALDEVTSEAGHRFLRKIVQIELEVPAPPEHNLREMLGVGLDRIHGRATFRWDPDTKERWRQLFEDAVWPYFDTPRDVKRFLSVFEFYFEGHIVADRLEVNFTDLVLLETLRMFDTEAYEDVRRGFQKRRNIVLELLFDRKETQEQFALGIKRLLDERKLSESEKSKLRALLFGMFPQARENGSTRDSDWDRDNRICHPRHFPKYFQLVPSPGDVPGQMIADVIKPDQDRQGRSVIFLKAAQEDVFMRLVQRVRAVADDIPERAVESMIGALFDISDDLPIIKGQLEFEGDGERELAQFAIFLLARLPNLESRGQVLSRASMTSRSVTGPVMCASMLESRAEKESRVDDQIVGAETIEELKKSLVSRIWAASESGKLWTLRMAAYLVYRLRDWAGLDVTRAWLAEQVNVPGNAATFLREMLQVSSVSGGRRYRKIYRLPIKHLAEFVDLNALHASASRADIDELLKLSLDVLAKASRNAGGQPVESAYVASRDESGKLIVDKTDATL